MPIGFNKTLSVACIMLLGAVLRVVELNSGLWLDEVTTLLDFARSPIPEIFFQYSKNNHPLYSLLAHACLEILGEQPWSLRIPAVVFGIACIPTLYILGAQVTSKLEALLAATSLALSYHHIWFSQDARGYTGLAFWTLLSSFFLLKGLRHNRTSWYIGYAVAASLGIYTHLSMGFMVLAHALLCVWQTLRKPSGSQLANLRLPVIGFLLTVAFSLLLYAPILPQVLQIFSRPSPLRLVATHQWAFWEVLQGLRTGFGTWGAALGLVFLACGVRDYFDKNRLVLLLAVIPAVLIAAGTFILQLPMQPRFFFMLIGFALLIVVRGAMILGTWAARRWKAATGLEPNALSLGLTLVSVMLLANAISLRHLYRYPKQDYEGAMRYVEAHRVPGEPVIAVGVAARPYRDYYGKDWIAVKNRDEIDNLASSSSRVWLLYVFPQYMDLRLVTSLQQICPQVAVFPGSLSGGDVFVCPIQPVKTSSVSQRRMRLI